VLPEHIALVALLVLRRLSVVPHKRVPNKSLGQPEHIQLEVLRTRTPRQALRRWLVPHRLLAPHMSSVQHNSLLVPHKLQVLHKSLVQHRTLLGPHKLLAPHTSSVQHNSLLVPHKLQVLHKSLVQHTPLV
jgi:hypothetical protein